MINRDYENAPRGLSKEVVDEYLKTIEVRNPAIDRLRFAWNVVGSDAYMLYTSVMYSAPDRDAGKPIEIIRESYTEMRNLPTLEHLRQHVMKEIKTAFTHEFEECFFVGGRRVLDPHANDKPTYGAPVRLADLPRLDMSIGFKNPPPQAKPIGTIQGINPDGTLMVKVGE
jgi:hypothetical protein